MSKVSPSFVPAIASVVLAMFIVFFEASIGRAAGCKDLGGVWLPQSEQLKKVMPLFHLRRSTSGGREFAVSIQPIMGPHGRALEYFDSIVGKIRTGRKLVFYFAVQDCTKLLGRVWQLNDDGSIVSEIRDALLKK